MLDAARRMMTADPELVLSEALGLAGLCVVILAGLFLPLLA